MNLILLTEVENILAKGEISSLSNFFFCQNVLKSRLLQRRQKARERVNDLFPVLQDYEYGEAWNRSFTKGFYKQAKKNGFNIEEYNRLCSQIVGCESHLRRLRDPLQVHLPIREIE